MQEKIGARLLARIKPGAKPYEINDAELPGFILRVQPSGVASYLCSYRLADGRRTRITIGRVSILTPAQARDRARELLVDVSKGIDPVAAKRKARIHSFKAFLDEKYEPWVTAHRKSAAMTLGRLRTRFPDFMNKQLGEITPWIVEKWRTARLKDGRAAATVNRDIAALKSTLSKAVEWDILDAHPLSKVKPLKIDSKGVVRYLSADEEQRLRAALETREARIRAGRERANLWREERGYEKFPDLKSVPFADYVKPMVLLAMNTGLRRGEIFNLSWENIDLDQLNLTVAAAAAKSGETRHIPLNPEAAHVLRQWFRMNGSPSSGLVFPGEDGKPMTDVKRAWASVLDLAEVTAFRFHDLRHHFASKLVMTGVDLNTVRELLGHADLKMTLRYAHLAPHVKAEAVNRLVAQTEIYYAKQA